MIATALLGVAALGVMQITKTQMKTKIIGQIDDDIVQTNARITSYLTNPAHCNANFSGLVTGTNVNFTNIKTCPSGSTNNCRSATYAAYGTGAAVGTGALTIPATTAAWDFNTTKISSRVRIKSMSYTVSSMTGTAVATLILTVNYQKKVPDTNSPDNTKVVDIPPKDFSTSVVVVGTNIAGCPKAWNSTFVY